MALGALTYTVDIEPGDDPKEIVRYLDRALDQYNHDKRLGTPAWEVPQLEDGWTQTAWDQFLAKLLSQGRSDYVTALQRAAARGGYLSRSEYLKIIGRDPGGYLKGVSKPLLNAMTEMQRENLLGVDAEHPLRPQYEVGNAAAFRMPDQLVRFTLESPFLEHWDRAEKSALTARN